MYRHTQPEMHVTFLARHIDPIEAAKQLAGMPGLDTGLPVEPSMKHFPTLRALERAARRKRRWRGEREADSSQSIDGKAHLTHGPEQSVDFIAEQGRTLEITF